MHFYGLPRPENLNDASRLTFNNMKRLVYLGISLAACALCFVMVRTPPVKKAGIAVDEAQRRLRAFESGSVTLKSITGNQQSDRLLLEYYESGTNEITDKMKLPISGALMAFGKYREGGKLAGEYVQVYSNDSRGWKILGAAHALSGEYEEAFAAVTNSVRLGDKDCLARMMYLALKLDRLEMGKEIAPALLQFKDETLADKGECGDMVVGLCVYSLQANDSAFFYKAIRGISLDQILSREDLRELVKEGCGRFKDPQGDKLLREIEEHKATGTKTEEHK